MNTENAVTPSPSSSTYVADVTLIGTPDPSQPPCDNAHVAEGCEQFSEPKTSDDEAGQAVLAERLLTVANAIFPEYATDLTPADYIAAVNATPVAAALGVLAIATTPEFVTVVGKNPLGEPFLGKIPHADFAAAFPPPREVEDNDLLLVLFSYSSEDADSVVRGTFITTRANLALAIGKEASTDVDELTTFELVADDFTILSDDQAFVERVALTVGEGGDFAAEGGCDPLEFIDQVDSISVSGYNPLDFLTTPLVLGDVDVPADEPDAEVSQAA